MAVLSTALRVAILAALLVVALVGSGAAQSASGAAQSTPSPGPAFSVRDVTVAVGERSFDARVYAPSVAGPHPVIVFGHGYLATVERYDSTLSALARAGFLVVAPRSGDGLFPDHAAFAADFSVVLDWLETQDADPGSWLHGSVLHGAYGASGHSMGGGASLLAAAADPRFVTVANLAAAETRPSAIAVMSSITAPVLLIGGSEDAIAPVADHQLPLFEAKTNGPAQLRVIQGGSHCGFLDPDALLALACDNGSLPVDAQLHVTARLLTDWLRYQLLGDDTRGAVVWPTAGDAQVSLDQRDRPMP
ncbi:MAG: dienelactone hydrolase family protein [Chloroflexi bacterium]|nr:dienelactone hydrolase family protein [Chloroflexota bacterium]